MPNKLVSRTEGYAGWKSIPNTKMEDFVMAIVGLKKNLRWKLKMHSVCDNESCKGGEVKDFNIYLDCEGNLILIGKCISCGEEADEELGLKYLTRLMKFCKKNPHPRLHISYTVEANLETTEVHPDHLPMWLHKFEHKEKNN